MIPTIKTLQGPGQRVFQNFVGNFLEGRAKRLLAHERDGTWIPAVCSIQLLTACNLRCEGCHVSGGAVPKHFDRERYHRVLSELEVAGCRMVLLIGGEPMLMAEEVFCMAETFLTMTFLVFTNGLLWKKDHIDQLEQAQNLVPLISVEGGQELTDERRGRRVFERLSAFQADLAQRNLLHGISVMVHSGNVEYLQQNNFLTDLFPSPHHFAFYMAYTARGPCASFGPLEPARLAQFYKAVIQARETQDAPILFLPHDEMVFLDGCSGARLLVHLNSDFSLALCPYAYDSIVAKPGYDSVIGALQKVQASCGVSSTCVALEANKKQMFTINGQ